MSEERHFDLLVLGGGSGGVACARRAAEYGARVALVEGARLGGTCVNVGCVPKKVMWFAAERAHALASAAEFGFTVEGVRFDWQTLVRGRDAFVARLNGIYAQMLEGAEVTVFRGTGRFCAPRTIEVDGQRLCGEHVVIATGGQAVIPPVPGAELGMSSDGFFALREQPRRVVVAGSGYIAVELAGVLRALGSEVDLLVRSDRLLRPFDALLRETVAERLSGQGVRIHWRTQAASVARANDEALSITLTDQTTLAADALLWAVGREPNTAHLNLAAAGVNTRANG
ncbi:MAG: FAD-dependent oxidoreductase, partial [Ottowia sp.]|nr:FAD-dependent oxidoreductase [Ottowia sp.]